MSQASQEDSLDVRLLQRQDLPQDEFPGGRGEVFRVYFAPEVHGALWRHASEDTSVEICGVLVGTWQRDSVGPFVRITGSIRGEAAASKFAEVTFTHETWSKINAEMDSRFVGLSIVGWYHTHPDFGIFLSDRDRFIQEHFFSGPGQVAHVIDPIRKTEGVFVWREGKPVLSEHFWVGDRVLVGTATASAAEARHASSPEPRTAEGSGSPAPPSSFLPPPGRMMIFLAVFLLGYLLAGMRSSWEQRMIVEGAVAHFGIWKELRPGLREELDGLMLDLAKISRGTEVLEASASKPEGKSKPAVTWNDLRTALTNTAVRVDVIRAKYGYSDEEQDAIRRMLVQSLTEKEPASRAETSAEKKASPPASSATEKSSEKTSATK